MTKTRHSGLADGLAALMAYRERPETSEPITPVKTNWTVVPANDNAEPEDIVDFGFERHLRITPSVQEIFRHVQAGPVARNDAGQVVGIGGLRFSDGSQKEKAYCYGPEGKLIQYDATMPAGAMLGTRDKADGQLGGSGHKEAETIANNVRLAQIMGTDYPVFVRRGERRNGSGLSHNEAIDALADAYANTPVLPEVKVYPTGLPCGQQRPSEAFVGLAKGKKGESGTIAWEDIASSMVSREIWRETLLMLADDDVATLDHALEAKTMQDIGEAHGFTGKRAQRMGKRILHAANDNLAEAMKIAS